jgi:hypothetical protein
MRSTMTWLIVVGAVVATAVTEFLVFGTVQRPDGGITALAGLWLAAPYLAAIGLALLLRNRPVAQIVLLVAFVIAAGIGLTLFGNAAINSADAEEQLRTAVQPGEDPSSGPGAKRKAGAEIGTDITWGVAVALAAFVPPIQFAVVVIPTLIGWGVVALRKEQVVSQPGG